MRRSALLFAVAVLLAVGAWHLVPASAQQAPGKGASPSASAATITFDAYRDYRMHYIAQRQARLAQQLASPNLSADARSRLEGIKAYYDRYAAMPAAERDRLFRARFDQIDTNHDGKLDDAERAAWREKRRQYYSEVEAERANANADQR